MVRVESSRRDRHTRRVPRCSGEDGAHGPEGERAPGSRGALAARSLHDFDRGLHGESTAAVGDQDNGDTTPRPAALTTGDR